jgi:hypothetical protein
MALPDPIAPVVQALTLLVAPNPALNTASPQPVTTWTSGATTATKGTLYVPLEVALALLFGLSSDLESVGKAMNMAVTDVAHALATIANQMDAVTGATTTQLTSAFNAIESVLSLAQSLAPSSARGALGSASGLFQQLQAVISAATSIEVSVDELGELSQQLSGAAQLFPQA